MNFNQISVKNSPATDNDKRKIRKHRHFHLHGVNAPPVNVSIHHWKDMVKMSLQSMTINSYLNEGNIMRKESTSDTDDEYIVAIDKLFDKRECNKYIKTLKESQRCGCGRLENEHSFEAIKNGKRLNSETDIEKTEENWNKNYIKGSCRWSIKNHTKLLPTDAYGTIEFQGGPRPIKSQYIRLSFDSDCASIIHLLENIWQIPPPKLVISIHGGTNNFNLQPKLARIFRNGLIKSASTTGAWIITSGCDDGVTKHVAAAIENCQNSNRNKTKIISIGIAPWGLLKRREDFIGKDHTVLYRKTGNNMKSRFITLNNRHSYFLLTDNGTVGKWGSEIILRRRLETYIKERQTIANKGKTIPVVCVILEGGTFSIRTALQYVTTIPKTPVVVCDGSGRASDMLSFTHHYIQEDGQLPEILKKQLLSLIESVFQLNQIEAEHLLKDLLACASQKEMLTIFRSGGEHKNDFDHAILTALLKGYDLTPTEQLSLALSWNRVDIARSDIFHPNIEWKMEDLHNIMIEALIYDRVDFVRLLLENGVDMQKFLTIGRLEELYNSDKGPTNTLYYIVRDVTKINHNYRYKLTHIGLAMEKLIGNGFKSYYSSDEFRKKYCEYKISTKKRVDEINKIDNNSPNRRLSNFFPFNTSTQEQNDDNSWKKRMKSAFNDSPNKKPKTVVINLEENTLPKSFKDNLKNNNNYSSDCNLRFRYPFNELLVWAVLTKRHEMARCMWEHGEESMAKALIACALNRNLAKEAREDYLDVEISDDLKKNAEEFKHLALDLLDCCYRQDDDKTLHLLTYELKYWGNETNISLAVMGNNKQFLAHPCCQMLLADLWHGGMRIRSNSNLKVIMGILFFPSIFALEYKTKEELMLQPQTAAEHENEVYDSSSSEDDTDTSDSDNSSSSDDDSESYQHGSKSFFGSNQSLHFSSILPSRLRRSKKESKQQRRQSIDSGTSNVITKRTNKKRTISLSNDNVNNNHQVTENIDIKSTQTKKEILDPTLLINNTKNKSNNFKKSQEYQSNIENKQKESVAKPIVKVKPKKIKAKRKLYEFISAPITTFWTWFLSYVAFLMANIYVLLIKTENEVRPLEYILFVYVVVFGLEEIRKLFMSEPTKIKKKLTFFFSDTWNWITTLAVTLYIIGFILRAASETTTQDGRVILAIDSTIWILKILDYLTIHPKFGIYITMVLKMVIAMSYHIALLFISLLAFGLPRQSIFYPNENWSWVLVRNIFYKPYFMLYGEVYAGEIDLCTDEGTNCVPGNFVPPILMTIFLLIANLLLISMLMATFNNIFNEVSCLAKQYWLFQRYHQVMKYESSPVVPPPFTIIYHIYWIGKYIWYRNTFNIRKFAQKIGIVNVKNFKKEHIFDNTLKLFLSLSQVEKIHDFEEECMEALTLQQEDNFKCSTDTRIKNTSENTETILSRVSDVVRSEGTLKEAVSLIETRLNTIEVKENELMEHLRHISEVLPQLFPKHEKISRSSYNVDQITDYLPSISDHGKDYQDSRIRDSIRRKLGTTDYTSITDSIVVKNLTGELKEGTHFEDIFTEDDKDEDDYDVESN
ncbi:Transient receptor potential cation channel subfamily M member 1 [Strongyloides ratti]|uniref:Transient receptor potential cation channel subfamily M member 1 n=1 Tax=Strongyloides ratti TaxID=34506 RepID=A0A090LQK5_STRRB|nr:Transient receptor potential cation channel subfamily M member 1 [Strongyloides ratti]CEF69851.1 Transient receptor potential cation channel subfamily M member 1 [Strongyloides ratti]